jgi:hypothetical protein
MADDVRARIELLMDMSDFSSRIVSPMRSALSFIAIE